MTDKNKYASNEQLRYARVLSVGVIAGFVLLVGSFFLYVTGILKPLVPIDKIPQYWGLPADQFVKVTHSPTGWAWLSEIGKGDILNLLGVAVLASVSIVSTLAVLPLFARSREKIQIVIAVLLVAVLIFAASNVLARFH